MPSPRTSRSSKASKTRRTPDAEGCYQLLHHLIASESQLDVRLYRQRFGHSVAATIANHEVFRSQGPDADAAIRALAAQIAAAWPLFRLLDGRLASFAKRKRPSRNEEWYRRLIEIYSQGASKNRAVAQLLAEIGQLDPSRRPKVAESTVRKWLQGVERR